MTLSEDRTKVFCHGHNRWEDIREQTIPDDDNILCLICGAHLGYRKDIPEIYEPESPAIIHIKENKL